VLASLCSAITVAAASAASDGTVDPACRFEDLWEKKREAALGSVMGTTQVATKRLDTALVEAGLNNLSMMVGNSGKRIG